MPTAKEIFTESAERLFAAYGKKSELSKEILADWYKQLSASGISEYLFKKIVDDLIDDPTTYLPKLVEVIKRGNEIKQRNIAKDPVRADFYERNLLMNYYLEEALKVYGLCRTDENTGNIVFGGLTLEEKRKVVDYVDGMSYCHNIFTQSYRRKLVADGLLTEIDQKEKFKQASDDNLGYIKSSRLKSKTKQSTPVHADKVI